MRTCLSVFPTETLFRRYAKELQLGNARFDAGDANGANDHYRRGLRISTTFRHEVLIVRNFPSALVSRESSSRHWYDHTQLFGKMNMQVREIFRCLKPALKLAETTCLQFVVAPFEADSQLVHLEAEGLIQAIWSPDHDLVLFGARRLVLEVEFQDQKIRYIDRTLLPQEFQALTRIQMITLALVLGCDYLRLSDPEPYDEALAWTRLHVSETAGPVKASEEVKTEAEYPPGCLAQILELTRRTRSDHQVHPRFKRDGSCSAGIHGNGGPRRLWRFHLARRVLAEGEETSLFESTRTGARSRPLRYVSTSL